ncbi:Heat stress transcription factor [Trichinella pseudospiralis]
MRQKWRCAMCANEKLEYLNLTSASSFGSHFAGENEKETKNGRLWNVLKKFFRFFNTSLAHFLMQIFAKCAKNYHIPRWHFSHQKFLRRRQHYRLMLCILLSVECDDRLCILCNWTVLIAVVVRVWKTSSMLSKTGPGSTVTSIRIKVDAASG